MSLSANAALRDTALAAALQREQKARAATLLKKIVEYFHADGAVRDDVITVGNI